MTAVVYFIESDDGNIKIGQSKNVVARLRTLSTSTHRTMTLLGVIPGGTAKERELHERFSGQRLHREWFRDSDELRAYIAAHCIPLNDVDQPIKLCVGHPNLGQARLLLAELIAPVLPGETITHQLRRALAHLPGRWSYHRIKSIWYLDPRTRISVDDLQELAAARGAKDKLSKDASINISLADLLKRIAFLEARITRLEQENRTLRGPIRSAA